MTINAEYVSLHNQCVKIVADALRQASDLIEDAATQLAIRASYALDHIPEKVR